MEILTKAKDIQKLSDKIRQSGRLIGFVPTMGYLHKGHLSLVDEIRNHCDVIIMSIFVNPLQFGPNEDFEKYPRDFEHDHKLAESVEVDYLFYPSVDELYPSNPKTIVKVKDLQSHLEGISRPEHFDGVTTVVAKLFNIVKPHVAIFGQKDLQQSVIVRKMSEELNFDIKILVSPIIRESDGLAMSSRNVYLSEIHRKQAPKLFASLQFAQKLILTGEMKTNYVIARMKNFIEDGTDAVIDYISIINLENFNTPETLENQKQIAIVLAVKFGSTRLLDNMIIDLK